MMRNDIDGARSGFFGKLFAQFQNEFGSPDSLYWIGLDRLHRLTLGKCHLRFDFQHVNGSWYFAEYSTFSVDDVSTKYRIHLGGYSGNFYNSFGPVNGFSFSAINSDNDGWGAGNCARERRGGFWYFNCGSCFITAVLGQFRWYNGCDLNYIEARVLCYF